MTNLSNLTGYEPGLIYGGCEWSPANQDGCTACSGSQCWLCYGIGEDCQHDSLARHYRMPVGYRESLRKPDPTPEVTP